MIGGDSVTCLSKAEWFLFLTSVILGILAVALFRFFLMILSLLILYIILSVSPKFRHHEMAFLFPLSFFACLPFNIFLAIFHVCEFHAIYPFSLQTVFFFLLFFLIQTSVEELAFGMIGVILWGKQKAIFCMDEKREERKMNGYYLKEILH